MPPSGGAASQSGRLPESTGMVKRVVAAIQGNPHTLYNKLNLGNAEPGIDSLARLVGAGLTLTDDAGRRLPELAEAVPTIDNGEWIAFPDGRMRTS
jgi:hypothetical protein